MMGRLIPPIPAVITVSRPGRAADGQGGFTRTFVLNQTTRGRVTVINARERTIADRMSVEATHVGYIPQSVSVRAEDRITFGGHTYEVTGIENPGGFGHHSRVLLLEVTGNG